MSERLNEVINNSFYQLLVVYTLLILIMSFGFISKYSFQMSLFALIVAILGIFVVKTENSNSFLFNKKVHYTVFFVVISLLIIGLRVIPYVGNSIPLGYDTGLYKYGIEHGLENLDKWILNGGMEPGFLYLMKSLSLIFSTQTLLTWVLIFFCLLLGLSVWFFTAEYFDRETALIAFMIYAVSVIQFKTFWYMYYKNIIALSLALCAFVFFKKSKDKKWYRDLFILSAVLVAAIHRPTFYIFGLTYLIFALTSPYSNKTYNWKYLKYHIINGVLVLVLSSLFYLGKFRPALGVLYDVGQGFLQTGESPGTFINFFEYQYATLPYLLFGLLGFFLLAKKRQFNPIFIWGLVCGVIVYFQFFFFNRFIIHLDIALIILSAYGFSTLTRNKEKLGTIIVAIMLIASGIAIVKESLNAKPLISDIELDTIKHLQNTETNAFVMSTSAIYSPWLQGYSERRVIAPGFLDYNKHDETQWRVFWNAKTLSEVGNFLNKYEKPLYIFIGQQQNDNLAQFNKSTCFSVFYENQNNKIYKYTC